MLFVFIHNNLFPGKKGNSSRFALGGFIGADALGLYAKVYSIFVMPITQNEEPITNVPLQALCALKAQPEGYVKYYQRPLDIMVSLTIPQYDVLRDSREFNFFIINLNNYN